MGADQPSSRGPGRPRTSQNAGTARGELARWLRDVATREPALLNSAIAARAGVTGATVGRAMRGETFASAEIVAAVVDLGTVTEQERRDHPAWITELAELDARHGRAVPGSLPPPPWSRVGEERPPDRRRRVRRTVVVIGAVAVLLVGLSVVLVVGPGGAPPMNRVEQVANASGTPTFADPVHGAGETGPRVPASAFVEVSCKVYAPIFASVLPDGYWYRIESPPWNGNYFAVANTFANGDLPGAVPPTNTDRSVPDC